MENTKGDFKEQIMADQEGKEGAYLVKKAMDKLEASKEEIRIKQIAISLDRIGYHRREIEALMEDIEKWKYKDICVEGSWV